MHYRVTAIFLISVFSLGSVYGQYDDLVMQDYTYATNIKSVSLSPSGSTLDPAITFLNNGVRLVLSFDDMDGDIKDYTYDVIHCDRNWNPSDMQKQEYIDGFVNEEVDNYRFSTGTYVQYTNYDLSIPNRDMRVVLSGNYVLAVYEGEEVEDRFPILTRRFVVVDRKVNVTAKPRRPMKVLKMDTHQEFDLYLSKKDFQIVDPQLNVKVSITQNGNWYNSIDTLAPRVVIGDKIIIDNTNIVSFPGLKEYRSLDIRSFSIASNDVHSIDLHDEGTDVLVKLGFPRKHGTYSSYPDADGAFIIATKDQSSNLTQSDYCNVIFTLQTPEVDEDVYVTGKFTDWLPEEQYRMTYDDSREIYIAQIQLKQGFYDYMFAVEKDGVLDAAEIEGSSYQAQNFYQVLVYLREPGDRYDRVIGYAKLNPGFY